ncbi:hypothetical protein ABPG77_007438 [Micractinium sp. CCAP 211/92]
MDFSFVGGDAGLQRKQQQPAAGGGQAGGSAAAAASAAQAPTPPSRIAIPSFRDVQQAERKRVAVPNMFQPSSVPGGTGSSTPGQQHSGQPQQPRPPLQQQQQGVNPFTFMGGSGSAQSPALQQGHPRPQGAPPPQQHPQHQQYQAGQYRPQGQHYQQQQAQPVQGQYRVPGPSGPQPRAGSASQYPNWQQQQQQQQQPRPGFQQPLPPAQQQLQQLPANAIIVSRRQNGNPVLKYIRNVRWQFADNVVPDFLLGKETACLFLSLRYHLLKPEYIHSRIKELQRSFRLRLILCHVDTEDAVEPLAQVTRAAIGNDFTLICGWSNQECARYLETFKSYENKPAEVIQKDLGTDYLSRINAALTTVRGVNRTDVKTLGDRFGSVAGIFKASAEELQACPGIGPTKEAALDDEADLGSGLGGEGSEDDDFM